MAAHPAAAGKGMIAVERPSAALMRKVHKLLGAGDLAQLARVGRALPVPDMRWAYRARHVPDARQAAAEMFGVLRPGGQIAVPAAATTF